MIAAPSRGTRAITTWPQFPAVGSEADGRASRDTVTEILRHLGRV